MKEKTLNTFFIAVFIAALLVPLLFVNLSGGGVSEKENRMLAARPPLSDALKHPKDFIARFDAWFSDNVGFRENLIDSYKLFASGENNVRYMDGQIVMLIGEQGHHFYAESGGWMIDKFQGKTFLADAQLQGLADGMNKAKSYLDERGIPLVTMFCADKESIYPEYYPKTIKRGSEPIQLDIITDYAKTHTDVDVFNIKECLLAAKEDYLVFDKVGDAAGILSHYNEIGAFFAYQELMKHINAALPHQKMEVFTIDDVVITYSDKGPYPNIPDVHLKKGYSYRRLDDAFFDGVPLQRPSQGLAFENIDSTLPTILFLRDSYTGDGNYISRYIPEHFGRTVLIHCFNMKNLETYVELYQPDIVVFEAAERGLYTFADLLTSYANIE